MVIETVVLRRVLASDGYQLGDKVRIKAGASVGSRGEVVFVKNKCVTVRLGTGNIVDVPMISLTNYSMAARRARTTTPRRILHPKRRDVASKRDSTAVVTLN